MSRRGQEEVVGFVAIILIVALVVIFFLGISLRDKSQNVGESQALSQFIEGAKKFTTSCDLGLKERYANLERLAEECYRNPQSLCVNGMNACEVYNDTVIGMLDTTWKVGSDNPVKGYLWNISYERAGSKEVIAISNGTCEGQYREEESLSPDSIGGGTFVTHLRTCF